MEGAAIGLAATAFVFALIALARVSAQARRFEDESRDLRRRLANLAERSEEAGEGVDLRRVVAALADGVELTGEMVLEGRLWHEIGGAEALELVRSGRARVLDVRTPAETAAGVLPDAVRIPLDELEHRSEELPRDGKPLLVYCAMGMRSAAACEYLSGRGFGSVHNLAGGIGAWTGPTVQP